MSTATKTADQIGLERLVFFTDAVIAIAITLLVLEIKIPPGRLSEQALGEALVVQVPKMVGFALSFVVIGAFWQGHHRMFRYVTHLNSGLVVLNQFFLLFICFLPFPTGVFSEHPNLQLPFLVYGGSLAAAGLMQWNMWRYLASRKLLADHITTSTIRWIGRRTLIVPFVALAAVALSYVSLEIAGMTFGSIPIWITIVNRLARRAGVTA
ncbi:TMEM175 family protein [Roseiterribacter gracilis]|uniref:DUF1211 domain-containing membrane protein n=1 Tax=Roseiterribacter gracilis TaxID=2812848 RepID=A0A8S8XJ34_9PROT|nr:DUF1211 domain-containing membrane protein [Rhodospirillales bacterium TMPK1]